MFCVSVIGVACAIAIVPGMAVLPTLLAKLIDVDTPISAFAAATASRRPQLVFPLVLTLGSTQFAATPFPVLSSVFTVTT
jgi:hypothetical protein